MTDLQLDVYTSPMRDLSNGGQFSPTTATLVLGPTEAVLVDTRTWRPTSPSWHDASRHPAGRSPRSTSPTPTPTTTSGSNASSTSSHRRARSRFLPSPPSIAAGNETARIEWAGRFGGEALDNNVVPEPLEGDTITIDGHPLHAINVGQADIPNNTILHIPSLDAVIAGDVIYNGINPFLAASGPRVAIVDRQRRQGRRPRTSHRHRRAQTTELPDDDLTATLDATRDYIQDFSDESSSAPTHETWSPAYNAATPITATRAH